MPRPCRHKHRNLARLRMEVLESRWNPSNLFAVETSPIPSPDLLVPAASPSNALPPDVGDLGGTFFLHSDPASTRKIYLDFNGEDLTDGSGGWGPEGDIKHPAYDFEGGADVFTNAELRTIQEVWLRVSEAFSMFQVDVTTEDPGPAFHGTRVIIGGDGSWYDSVGGVAFVGSFGPNAVPCFVFSENGFGSNDKTLADCINHEVGHTLGLTHMGRTPSEEYFAGHGTGPTSWAPIMGEGYSRNIVTWSKGEYEDSDNTTDELAVIASKINIRADDHADDELSATDLTVAPMVLSAEGLIQETGDVDYFQFTAGTGAFSLTIATSLGSMLDIRAEIYDSDGNLVAFDNPAAEQGASFDFESLLGGTYYLKVQGVGFGDPATNGYSNYSSIGRYFISGAANSIPTVRFASTTYTVTEGETTARIAIERVSGLAGPLVVTVNRVGGTASEGGDYAGSVFVVSIPSGASTGAIVVPIIDDSLVEGAETLLLTISAAGNTVIGSPSTATLTILDNDTATPELPTDEPPPPTVTPPTNDFVPRAFPVGFAVGDVVGAQAALVEPNGTVVLYKLPFGAFHTGGVRVASGDVNGDGTPDLIAGSGPGRPTTIVVYDGFSGGELARFVPFELGFTGGIYVAAGDLDGDGRADIVATPDQGGGPRVLVFSGADFGILADFMGIQDDAFRGGARPAIGDVTGDGVLDLVISAGFGGGPRVTVWDGNAVLAGRTTAADSPLANFFTFEDTLRNGAFVAVGDVNADGQADFVFGGGPGGGPRVRVFDAAALLDSGINASNALADFFAGPATDTEGIRVAVTDIDGDDFADVLTGAGPGPGAGVYGFFGSQLTTGNAAGFVFDPFDSPGGVFVG